MSEMIETRERGILFPPGGLMVWMFIVIELLTFGGAFCVYVIQMAANPSELAESQSHLNVALATLNTLILVTSGFLAAMGVAEYHEGRSRHASNWVLAAAALGACFCAVKAVEYHQKLAQGFTMGFNTFYSFYWALTGFHFLHVAAGILALLYFAVKIRTGRVLPDPDMSLETGVAFWHLCDLIWVILFPLIYLIRR